ncbi:MAG: (E)-4-hydroxy-3-methylbut-2-enyl-diphosphate synthase [Elusimicrobiota bacterium]
MTSATKARSGPSLHVPDLYHRRRRKTRVVMVGKVGVGGENPIRLQSMTTTDTMDTEATAAQCARMAEAGCEIVRITTRTVEDARNLGSIREALSRRGIEVPLVADVHFQPKAALEAAEFAEKVRINPGNFVDAKRFSVREYTDAEYAAELERIESRFTPLVEKLKRLGRSLRIGTNHGSLSDRIMNRYGDSPLGMVESALEYVRICEKNGFHDIILSMKASDPKVMIQAYRLLSARMAGLGMDYPFHLGVTEAGSGEDGRVKSAIGIGSLLEDGIGDTIRVSLTEDPEREIPVCRSLARRFQPDRPAPRQGESVSAPYVEDLFSFRRRETRDVRVGPFTLGGGQPVRVIARLSPLTPADGPCPSIARLLRDPATPDPEIMEWTLRGPEDLEGLRAAKRELAGEASRLAHMGRFDGFEPPGEKALALLDMAVWSDRTPDGDSLIAAAGRCKTPLLIESENVERAVERERRCADSGVPAIIALSARTPRSHLHAHRRLAALLRSNGSRAPIHLKAPAQADEQALVLESSLLIGGLLCDGIGDSVQVAGGQGTGRDIELAYGILQASGVRLTRAEYVSCPSCGRTLFDLQKATARIRSKTGHLKGVKIAVMGCIVNGPGEMSDADFGYVGGAPGRINLYVGKKCVRKGISTEEADQALVELIRADGKWTDPPKRI